MGSKAYLNRVNKIKELEAQIKELENQVSSLKDEVKNGMVSDGFEEMEVGSYIVRYKAVTSQKFDSKSFQKAHSKMYAAFCSPSTSMRFTIN